MAPTTVANKTQGLRTLGTQNCSKTKPCGVFNTSQEKDLDMLPSLPSLPSMDFEEIVAGGAASYNLDQFMALPDELPAVDSFFDSLPRFDFSFVEDNAGVVPQLPTIATPELTQVNLLAEELAAQVPASVPTGKAASKTVRRRKTAQRQKQRVSGLTSTGQVRKRRPKQPVPDEVKDAKYWERRRKNNEAARRNRERKRMEEKMKKERVQGLDIRKQELTDEVTLLHQELAHLRELVRQRLSNLAA